MHYQVPLSQPEVHSAIIDPSFRENTIALGILLAANRTEKVLLRLRLYFASSHHGLDIGGQCQSTLRRNTGGQEVELFPGVNLSS